MPRDRSLTYMVVFLMEIILIMSFLVLERMLMVEKCWYQLQNEKWKQEKMILGMQTKDKLIVILLLQMDRYKNMILKITK